MKKHSQQQASSRRLLMLLGISLLLHGLLLFHWPTSKPVLEFDYQLQNLAVNLEPIEVIGQQQQARKKAVDISKPQPANITTPVLDKPATAPRSTPHRQTTQETSVAGKTMQDQQQQTASMLTTPSMNRARILSQIRHDLSQYFYYPPLARRKGMQGTVLLSFGVSRQGAIRDIRVVKSSGYAILDLAAQDAMQRLDKLSWYAALMHGKDMDIELPVIFRLTKG
ncbi:MAG: energy transducer TonB [Halobacteria archaeon]|nr:energy transducer TonB [Halobacteria archaeon]